MDAALFTRILKTVLSSYSKHEPSSSTPKIVSILDIGAGTGRVVLELLDAIAEDSLHLGPGGEVELRFEFTALDDSQAMLNRALKKCIDWIRQRKDEKSKSVQFGVNILCASAAKFAHEIDEESVQFAIFAAGGLTHLTEDEGIFNFLMEIGRVLDPKNGRAVISILREFLKGGGGAAGETSGEGVVDKDEEDVRLASKEWEGQIFVKSPTTYTWNGDLRSDKMTLRVEDEDGKVLRKSDLQMDVRMIEVGRWEQLVSKAGFEIVEKVDGDIQVWWILERMSDCKDEE
jgi:SAM-dependent methyltransferase